MKKKDVDTSSRYFSRLVWHKLKKNKSGLLGLIVFVLLIFIALFAPLLSLNNPYSQIYEYEIQPPGHVGKVLLKKNLSSELGYTPLPIKSFELMRNDTLYAIGWDGEKIALDKSMVYGKNQNDWFKKSLYLMGTDQYGRDIFSRILYGTRVSLSVGAIATLISLLIGVALGSVAGYFRGKLDMIIMWVINVVWSFPQLLLVLAISVALGRGFWQIFIAVGVVSWVEIARIVRGQFFSMREREFVEATRALGFSHFRTILVHILPNTIGPIIVVATAGFATAIIVEASLSFLGFGVQPPMPSWGSMLRDGYGYIISENGWWLTVFPGMMIIISVLSINLLGDGLRDALDTKIKSI